MKKKSNIHNFSVETNFIITSPQLLYPSLLRRTGYYEKKIIFFVFNFEKFQKKIQKISLFYHLVQEPTKSKILIPNFKYIKRFLIYSAFQYWFWIEKYLKIIEILEEIKNSSSLNCSYYTHRYFVAQGIMIKIIHFHSRYNFYIEKNQKKFITFHSFTIGVDNWKKNFYFQLLKMLKDSKSF